MPLRLDIKKKLSARSDRVKSVDFHPTEPWALSALYSGNVFIWDYNTQALVKQLEVCQLPVRCAKFVVRKQWIITASDDMHVRVFNYNTLEKVHEIEAHMDYMRCLAIHSSLPYLLTSSDDMTIKLWDWEKNWNNVQVFEGHAHYVMMVNWNPKDSHIFASCSLDRSLKVWGVTGTSGGAHFSLTGHQRGVNCVEYSPDGNKPYLISGSDDQQIRIWDYQTKQCIQTLTGHTNNVSTAVFHPSLPIILTGSEDGTVRVWHAATYRLEATLNYLLERVWSIAVQRGSNNAAIGYDEGTVVIKMGSDEPIASMQGGKVIWAKGNEIQTVNLKIGEDTTADGERVQLSVKDMGQSEIFPQYIAHHPNGRLFAVCGDGEYVVYTAQALRNKSFGPAVEFAWGNDGGYATRDAAGKISVFQDFKEAFAFKPPFQVEEIYGGRLLGVRSADFICFYHWGEYRLVRRIDVTPRAVYWNDAGTFVSIACADQFYILAHDKDVVIAVVASGQPSDEDGIEIAFELGSEIQDKVVSATWVGDCFVYTSQAQRLICLVAGQTETLAHLDRALYLLGYLPDQSKLYLIDKELNLTPHTLHLALVEYQSAILRKDFDGAQTFFKQLPESMHNRVARFLENQGYAQEALQISKDDDHRFDLAMQLSRLTLAAEIIVQAQANSDQRSTAASTAKGRWKNLGDVALEQGDFDLAKRAFNEAQDLAALFLLATCSGDAQELQKIAAKAKKTGATNVAVQCYSLLNDCKSCLEVLVDAERLPEAAFFARSYCPSDLPRVVQLWKNDLKAINEGLADSLADPASMPDMFPDYSLSLEAEKALLQAANSRAPAAAYMSKKETLEMNVLDEIRAGGAAALVAQLAGGAAPKAPIAPAAPAPAPTPAAAPAPPAPETTPAATGEPENTEWTKINEPELAPAGEPDLM
jgi:coatomer subunit beta'